MNEIHWDYWSPLMGVGRATVVRRRKDKMTIVLWERWEGNSLLIMMVCQVLYS